jgi:hypothetical protein
VGADPDELDEYDVELEEYEELTEYPDALDELPHPRVQYVPLLQLIVRKSPEMFPVIWPPANGPQLVFRLVELANLPVAAAPTSFESDTDEPL